MLDNGEFALPLATMVATAPAKAGRVAESTNNSSEGENEMSKKTKEKVKRTPKKVQH